MYYRYFAKPLWLVLLPVVGLMMVSVSDAQAKYLLLLNGASVSKIKRTLEGLGLKLTTEIGQALSCTGGTGIGTVETVESGLKAPTTSSVTLNGCVWEGAEKTCTINDGSGNGIIHIAGSGQVTMENSETYAETIESAELGTIVTTGAFCTLEEEAVISGAFRRVILEPLKDTKVKLSHLTVLNAYIAIWRVATLKWEVHISDENPNATFALHLVNL
jgi:hypothetical protein